MGRPRKTQPEDNTNSTVETRRANQAAHEAAVNEERQRVMAETREAQRATDKRLSTKPADSRTIA